MIVEKRIGVIFIIACVVVVVEVFVAVVVDDL
jgi:hypothetical protein